MTRDLLALLQGVAVQAGASAIREELEQVAGAALAVWPER